MGRVIFVATPHRGTAVDRGAVRSAGSWLARAVSPSSVAQRAQVTSIDQLTWDHPLLADLERAGVAAGVPFHSIIAALREPSAEGATNGLVPVASARLGGARSEVVVRANHICYHHAEVIQEVRRVLIEHAASLNRPPQSEPWRSPSVGRGRPDPAKSGTVRDRRRYTDLGSIKRSPMSSSPWNRRNDQYVGSLPAD